MDRLHGKLGALMSRKAHTQLANIKTIHIRIFGYGFLNYWLICITTRCGLLPSKVDRIGGEGGNYPEKVDGYHE
jgi:hypothetical protein